MAQPQDVASKSSQHLAKHVSTTNKQIYQKVPHRLGVPARKRSNFITSLLKVSRNKKIATPRFKRRCGSFLAGVFECFALLSATCSGNTVIDESAASTQIIIPLDVKQNLYNAEYWNNESCVTKGAPRAKGESDPLATPCRH